MYSTESDTTKDVCKKIGFLFDVYFVETMKRNNKVYVRGTAGKRGEFQALKNAVIKAGMIYTGSTK
jgi:hypothetical protein